MSTHVVCHIRGVPFDLNCSGRYPYNAVTSRRCPVTTNQALSTESGKEVVVTTDVYPPSAGGSMNPRPLGHQRAIGLSILWAVITLGIYQFVWTYRTQEETKQFSGNGVGGVLGLVIFILIAPMTFFLVPSEVRSLYEHDGQVSPVRGTTGLWLLLPLAGPFVWFAKVQGALNHYWSAKGVPAA
jgi:hypothetical protein